jgi:hypothetical protein
MREGQTNGLGTVGIAHEQLVARQHGYGCTVLILDSGAVAPELILYRVKWIKGLIPCAQRGYRERRRTPLSRDATCAMLRARRRPSGTWWTVSWRSPDPDGQCGGLSKTGQVML